MKYLHELIDNSREWLCSRILYYAKRDKYEKYYNGGDVAWTIPFTALSKYLCKCIEDSNFKDDIKIDDELIYNSISAVGIGNIIHYYKEKIDVGIFLGTMKCYRNCYRDLVVLSDMNEKYKYKYLYFIERFFDRLEIISCFDWSKTSESEIKFHTLANITSAFIFMYDGERYVYVNKAAEEFTGYSCDEMSRMRFNDIFHSDFKEKLIDFEFDLTKQELHEVNTHELKILTKQGEERWIEFNAGIVYLGDEPMMLGIAFNIDKRKKAEEKLKRSEERYRKLVELMPDAVFVHSGNKIAYTNAAGAKLLGLASPEEIIGQDAAKFINIDIRKRIFSDEYVEHMINEGTLPIIEQSFVRKLDGKTVEIETTAALIPFHDGLAILDISRDVSERKKVEELEEKVEEKTKQLEETVEYDKLKTEFFANVSHELRTPLNVLLGALQLIELMYKNNSLSENKDRLLKYKDIMKQNCYRLVRLVNNLIDITKIDADYFEINLQNSNIVNVVENVTLSVAEYIESKGVKLIFDTDVEEKVIACDPDKIERIILNLLSNAIKFTESEGNIYVNIYDKDDIILISIKDTGIGIPEDKQEKIFERFIQVDKSLSRNREGSGIGLSLVKAMVEMHGGKISLVSEAGIGSEFIFEIPAVTLEDNSETEKASNYIEQTNIERINIEFSDIYSLVN